MEHRHEHDEDSDRDWQAATEHPKLYAAIFQGLAAPGGHTTERIEDMAAHMTWHVVDDMPAHVVAHLEERPEFVMWGAMWTRIEGTIMAIRERAMARWN